MDWMNRGFEPDDQRLEALHDALARLRELDWKIQQSKQRIEQINYDLKFMQMLDNESMLNDEFWEDGDES